MKSLRGFRKTYFKLSSILAHSIATSLQGKIVSLHSKIHCQISKEKKNLKSFSTEIFELHTVNNEFKPCLCNCFFNHLAHIMLNIHHYIPRCPYYTTYFAFRRTGVHPPLLSYLIFISPIR